MSAWKSIDKSQLTGALVLIALGAIVASEAWQWPYLTKDGPGPGFFPLWIGIILMGLAGANVVLQITAVARGKPDIDRTSWKGSGPVLTGWVALIVAVALLKPLGFTVAYALLTVFLIRFVFRRPWKAAMIVGAVSAVAFWFVFVKLLRVQLPAGPWGF